MGFAVASVEIYFCIHLSNLFNLMIDSIKSLTEDDESVQKYNPELGIPVVLSSTDRYDQSRSKNGCAIIFNFEKFQDSISYLNREGSQKDVNRLVKVFGDLNIDIGDRIYKNMTVDEMQTKFKEC